MKGYSNRFLILLRVTALKPDAKIRQARSIFGNDSRLYSDVANSAINPAAVKSAAPLNDLLGRRHDYLRISLTERCNLRCQYCMPAEGVPLTPKPNLLTKEELFRLVNVFASLGVHKLRLTGGEPTLRSDLAEIIEQLCSVPGIRSVTMTTNGLVLTRRLPALQRAGLTAINVSLDSLRADRYERMARRPGLTRVLAGIDLALQLGYRPVKINTVLMRGFNDDEICDFVEYTRDREVEVRFIEFMPFSGNRWDDSNMVPHDEALRAVRERYPRLAPTLPRACDTATVWQVEGHLGSVGFISSMTRPFCSTCNRLRLTADGNLKVCLFGAAEVSLLKALRAGASDDALGALVRAALRNKKPQHAAISLRSNVTSHLARITVHWESAATPAHYRFRSLTPRRLPRPRTGHRQPGPALRVAARGYCTAADSGAGGLTHLDAEGRARMVDVSRKNVTARAAEAECFLRVSARLLRLLRDASLPKGDALTVAQVAGALAAKRTADLIPMCHPLPLDYARVSVTLPRGECAHGGLIRVTCATAATARTGVEMEALTGAALAALALYDMCKSVDRHMSVTELRVVSKSGGAHDFKVQEPAPAVRAHDTSPHKPGETYAPTDLMHF